VEYNKYDGFNEGINISERSSPLADAKQFVSSLEVLIGQVFTAG
jgi:hypothetical protein